MEGREVLLKCANWQVKDGNLIRLWKDWWLPSLRMGHPTPIEDTEIDINQRVNSIICQDTGEWQLESIRSQIPDHEQVMIIPKAKIG